MDANFKDLSVLLVDDSKTIRRSAQAILDQFGCKLTLAIDGFDALCKIVEADPDIVFMDIMMPRLDGFQTCALIKNSGPYKNLPVVLLSAKDGIMEKARAELVGAQRYITKPFCRDDLASAMRSLCVALDEAV